MRAWHTFLAAATELKVRGLTQENQSNGGNPIDLLTLRNCDSEDKQPDSFKNNDGLKSKAKESITAENVNHDAEYDDYQDYTEVGMDDSFNESTSQSHNEGEPDNVSIISNNSKVSQDYTQVEMNDPNYEKVFQYHEEGEFDNFSTVSNAILHIETVNKKKKHTNALTVMQVLNKKVIWKSMLQMCIWRRSPTNALLVVLVLEIVPIWKDIFHLCMKRKNRTNASFVKLVLH